MRTLLICPGERSAVGHLTHSCPLAAIPIYGESILNFWLESLAGAGVKEARVLAIDRPEQVREEVGNGERWGLNIEVIAEMSELAPEAAAQKYAGNLGETPQIIVLDRLPGLPERPLFSSYADWFRTILEWMPNATAKHRLGQRQAGPQVWVGMKSQISSSARLIGPCWIGEQVRIGDNAVIGPHAVLENRVVVDSSAEVVNSIVGPETFIGELTRVEDSLAWGNFLINWRTNSCTQVSDAFLMCSLRRPETGKAGSKTLLQTLSNSVCAALKIPSSLAKKFRPRRF